MGIQIIGSISEYARNMKLSAKWQMKKDQKAYTQKSDAIASEFEQYREKIEKIREDSDPGKIAIYQKLQSGRKLTAEEEAYLKEHDAEAYRQYKEFQAEKESYERELKRCKTKDEVERVQMTRLGKHLSVVNMISNNPNIPKIKKMQLLIFEKAKLQAMEETTLEFKKSLQYNSLPTDAQKREEDEKRLEELQGEQGIENENTLTEGDKENGFENVLPEEGEDFADTDSPLPENRGETEDLDKKKEERFFSGYDIMKTVQEAGTDRTFQAYGRQAYQREVSSPFEEEKILKNKRG